ncbi:hypothetical protein BT69DRAFT_1316414 [Atractiella rhizophila]|nr:hypothetical protein BT69DRAFT_1316414 [Atractiella rhizophila]
MSQQSCQRCRRLRVTCRKPEHQTSRIPCQRCKEVGEICEMSQVVKPRKLATKKKHEPFQKRSRNSNVMQGFGSRRFDAKLGDVQRAFLLGQHLLTVVTEELVIRMPGPISSLDGAQSTWIEYYQLKLDKREISPYVDLWFKYLIARAASHSPHSDILGTEGTLTIPHRSFNDPLLDLRSYGQRRQEARGALMSACLSYALSSASPLRLKTKEALAILLSLIGSLSKPFLNGSQARSLIRLGLECLEALWETAEEDYKKQLAYSFEYIFTFDVEFCVDFGGYPAVEMGKFKKFMKGVSYPLQLLTNPFYFNEDRLPKESEAYREGMWAAQMCLFRYCASAREEVKLQWMKEAEVEQMCSAVYNLVIDFSSFYSSNFKPIESPDYDQEDCAFYTGPYGEESRWFSRIMFQNEELIAFMVFEMLRTSSRRFPRNANLKELRDQGERYCQTVIVRAWAWMHHALQIHKRVNTSLMHGGRLDIDLVFFQHFQHLPGGYRYFARWMRSGNNDRFVDQEDLKRILQSWKHMSWYSKHLADAVSDVEDEVQKLQAAQSPARDAQQKLSTQIEGFEQTYSELLRPQMEGFELTYSQLVRPPSPPQPGVSNLVDFDQTLSQVLS